MIPKEIEFWLFAWVRLWTLVQGLFLFYVDLLQFEIAMPSWKKVALVNDQGYQMTG